VSTDVVLSFYFHLKDIYPAAKIEGISFGRSIIGNTFVPRTESNKFSSSSKKFSQVTNNFSLVPSLQSHECETLACKGVETFCATSLESMIDNVISELGTQDIEVMTTVLIGNREGQNEEKSYKVTSRVKMSTCTNNNKIKLAIKYNTLFNIYLKNNIILHYNWINIKKIKNK
jgi:BURP domain